MPRGNDLDGLAERCKSFEAQEASRHAMPGLPMLARIDGRAFHTFTRGMARPFNTGVQTCMAETTRALVGEFQASVGYTQSDEMTLAWHGAGSDVQLPFGGRYQKLASVLAGFASATFVRLADRHVPDRAHMTPHFDARVWQVPSLQDALDVFIWREADAVTNSVEMAARALFTHEELHGRNVKWMKDALYEKGVQWNDYSAHFKRGVYFQRKVTRRELTGLEWSAIPEKHRPAPGTRVDRAAVELLELEPIRRVPDAVRTLFPIAAP